MFLSNFSLHSSIVLELALFFSRWYCSYWQRCIWSFPHLRQKSTSEIKWVLCHSSCLTIHDYHHISLIKSATDDVIRIIQTTHIPFWFTVHTVDGVTHQASSIKQ